MPSLRSSTSDLILSFSVMTLAVTACFGFLIWAASGGGDGQMDSWIDQPQSQSTSVEIPVALDLQSQEPRPTLSPDLRSASEGAEESPALDQPLSPTTPPQNAAAAISPDPIADLPPWRIVIITFVTVFVAEMGDKTQLATMLMSAQSRSPWAIFWGSATALVTASVISVLLGDVIAQVIPPSTLQFAAGIGFMLIGIYVLWAELFTSEECLEDD